MKDDITVQVFPELENRVVELSHTLERLMVDNAPEAWSLVLATIQIEYLTRASYGVIWLILLVTVFAGFKRGWNWANSCPVDPKGAEFLVICMTAIFGSTSTFGLMYCFSPWTWVGLFKPELIIAARILKGVM